MNYLELCRKIRYRVKEEIEREDEEDLSKKIGRGAFGAQTSLIDEIAERTVISELQESGIEAIVLSEEKGEIRVGREPSLRIVLDPIDGTFNAVRKIPLYSISIAFTSLNGDPLFGYVSSLAVEEEFYAMRGHGAFRNSKRIRVSEKKDIRRANISLYHDEDYPERVVELSKAVNRIRCYGCASLELCYVACGALDAFVDVRGKQRIVDIAAGMIVLEEAGGVITDDRGMSLRGKIAKINVVASNRSLHPKILELL